MYPAELLCKLAHILIGFIAGIIVWLSPAASCIITVLFILYEFFEKQVVEDETYPEIREYTTGYIIGALTGLLSNLPTVHGVMM